MRTQHRWTVKTTFAGARKPEHIHFAFENWGDGTDRGDALQKAKAEFLKLRKAATFEVVMIQLYEELHVYTIKPPVETYERDPAKADSK
ncbi:MAG: hypothetical protein ACRC7C_14355 [Beijerinckiaceae bacterium]